VRHLCLEGLLVLVLVLGSLDSKMRGVLVSWQTDAVALFDGRVEDRVGSKQGHRQLAGGKRCSRLALSVSFPLHDESLQECN
jgi:hypothetical protein